MKNILLLLALVATVAFIAGCSTVETSSDPKMVLTEFAQRLATKDFDGASKLATRGSKPAMEMVKMGIQMAEKMKSNLPQNDPIAQLQQAEFSEAKIDGNTAIVTVTNKVNKEQPPMDFMLVKENGGWKVDFSMAALTKMGRQQIDQTTGDAAGALDSLRRSLNSEEMKKALNAADSFMKNIDPKKLEDLQKQLQNLPR